MKVRQGFVSNSSTSSFCIFGIEIDQEQLDEMLGPVPKETGCKHEFDRETMKFCPTCGVAAWTEGYWEWEDYEKFLKQHGLHHVGSEGSYWVGASIEGKTIAEFPVLHAAAVKIRELFGEEPRFISGEYAS